ncbi:hypothetical protein C8P63_14312 [Melghirimyces profundicolus]|uniref:Uncharacterized protein n=1 Tax=Melghirimyces profundicolus TaxID=1242148 RepID=A0A2T6AYK2_9BACL|nr:hypothetical protein [Melghirimyces profundicolus]PTX48891.1 hypothetical protein C8P63_14312 [Melghirimyces profundicolus]
MKKWMGMGIGYYALCISVFWTGYMWLTERYQIFNGPVDAAGREPFFHWVKAFGILLIVPLGFLMVAAGVLTYRHSSPRPRLWITVLLGMLLAVPAAFEVFFGLVLFILFFHGFA